MVNECALATSERDEALTRLTKLEKEASNNQQKIAHLEEQLEDANDEIYMLRGENTVLSRFVQILEDDLKSVKEEYESNVLSLMEMCERLKREKQLALDTINLYIDRYNF